MSRLRGGVFTETGPVRYNSRQASRPTLPLGRAPSLNPGVYCPACSGRSPTVLGDGAPPVLLVLVGDLLFHELGEIQPGEFYVIRLSRSMTGLRMKADTAACECVVEGFEA